MLINWINNLTLTHILLLVLIVLLGILILLIRALLVVFYEDRVMGNRGNILNNIYDELLRTGGAMNLVVDAAHGASSDLYDIKDQVWNIQDEVQKLTRNIHTPR
jgi:hypothetical protein